MSLLFFALGAYLTTRYAEISALIDQRHAALSSALYSAPHAIQVGDDVARTHLYDRLGSLHYTQVPAANAPGEYTSSPTGLSLYLRGFERGAERFAPALVHLQLAGGKITAIADSAGAAARAQLEPETVGRLDPGAAAERIEVRLQDQQRYLVDGLLATEDQFFYYHPGINPVRIIKAAIVDVRERRAAQGASTLTQQLARTFLGRYERSFQRKLDELAVALVLEMRLSKSEILERYINDVSMGAYAGTPVHGMPQSARYLFNKDLSQVTPAEAATLIGMVQAPTQFDPRRHPEAARRRRDVVLGIMQRNGVIDSATLGAAVATPIELSPPPALRRAPYFADFVIASLREVAGFTGDLAGLKVFTTLDAQLQAETVAALTANLNKLEKSHAGLRRRKKVAKLQTAAVVLDAHSGAIRALVGGRNYADSQFNRATSALRQPGSSFKPFVYLAALDPQRSPIDPPLTLASLLPDEPLSFDGWTPENHERRFSGPVTTLRALAASLNVPAAYVGSRLGPELIVRTAHDVGMPQDLEPLLPIAIGAEETTLLDLTSAYQVLANGGTRAEPYSIELLADAEGREIYRHRAERRAVVRPEIAYLVTAALQAVLKSGTAAGAGRLGLDVPAAGKTGTSQDYRDANFIGYTPDVVGGVWLGFDVPQSLSLTGAQAALPAWVRIMAAASTAARDFAAPAAVVTATIDPQTGGLATAACPSPLKLPFLPGTVPRDICPLHGGAGLSAASERHWGGWRSTMVVAETPNPPAAKANVFRRIGNFFGSLFR